MGGSFTSFNGVSRTGLARLDLNGGLDRNFNPALMEIYACEVHVSSILVQPDDKLLIGGTFEYFKNGLGSGGVARLNPDGTFDTTFNTFSDLRDVAAITVQTDGKLLVGGGDLRSGGFRSLIRLNADGSLDRAFDLGSFDPGTAPGGAIHQMVWQSDGKLIVSGYFGAGVSQQGLARLNPDGSLDASFNPSVTDANGLAAPPTSMLVQPDGNILIGGYFRFVNGLRRDGIARLRADGSLDSSFYPGPASEAYVSGIALQPNGQVLASGHGDWNGADSSTLFRFKSALKTRSLNFTSANFPADENQGLALVLVERIGDTNGTVTVDYSTTPATATAGVDYTKQNGTLSFAPGDAAQVITIPILDDALVEDDKTVSVDLRNPSAGATLGPQPSAVLSLLDDDRPGSVDASFNPSRGTTVGGEEIADANRHLLLVVTAIVAILASLLLPALSSAKEQAKLIKCVGNQKQIGFAFQMYRDDNETKFPPKSKGGGLGEFGGGDPDPNGPANYLLPATNRPLWRYTQSREVCKCPSDRGADISPHMKPFKSAYAVSGTSYRHNENPAVISSSPS